MDRGGEWRETTGILTWKETLIPELKIGAVLRRVVYFGRTRRPKFSFGMNDKQSLKCQMGNFLVLKPSPSAVVVVVVVVVQ